MTFNFFDPNLVLPTEVLCEDGVTREVEFYTKLWATNPTVFPKRRRARVRVFGKIIPGWVHYKDNPLEPDKGTLLFIADSGRSGSELIKPWNLLMEMHHLVRELEAEVARAARDPGPVGPGPVEDIPHLGISSASPAPGTGHGAGCDQRYISVGISSTPDQTAPLVESADTRDLKSLAQTGVRVQISRGAFGREETEKEE